MEFHEFNQAYRITRARLRTGETADMEAEQQRLQALVASLPTEHDQQVARRLIAGLPALVAPAEPPTPEMTEALRILDTADFDSGTKEERLAALDKARKQIWAIADRAGNDSATIRGLTRMLERQEEILVDGLPWADPPPDDRADA
jgi:uncharacterized membrane protein YccC